MKTEVNRIIFQSGPYRIIEMQDEFFSLKDLKGDVFKPECCPEIDEAELKRQELDFENKVELLGVYGYELQYWASSIDKGWTCIDSCWGFVGMFDANSDEYNHYIVDELKYSIKWMG